MVTETPERVRVPDDAASPLDRPDGVPVSSRSRLGALILWLVAAAGLALFVTVGSIPYQPSLGSGRTLSVPDVWRRFGQDLPPLGHGTLLRAAVYGTLVLVLAAALIGLWLALTAVNPAAPEPSEGPRGE
jgi:hypothetical protein